MLIDKVKLAAILDMANVEWNGALQNIKPTWSEWAFKAPSTTKSNTYYWADLMVAIREWVGERQIGNLRANKWTVENKKYEGSFDLLIDDIEDDNYGLLKSQIQILLNLAYLNVEFLLKDLAAAAYTTVCHDGQYFIDTDHPTPDGTTTFSNSVGTAFSFDNVRIGLTSFYNLPGPNGKPLAVDPFAVMVGPSNYNTAEDILTLDLKPGGGGERNPLPKRNLKLILNESFVGAKAGHWQILAKPRGGILTPYVAQIRKDPVLSCTGINGDNEVGILGQDSVSFLLDKLIFGTKSREAATFTLPQLIYGSNSAT